MEVSGRELGIDRNRMIQIGDGVIYLPFNLLGVATVDLGVCQMRINGDRLTVVGNGPVKVSYPEPVIAAIVEFGRRVGRLRASDRSQLRQCEQGHCRQRE